MITREHLRLDLAIRYSWKVMVYSAICWTLAFILMKIDVVDGFQLPVAVVAILGTALAIILGFRNSSAYDRWWEARKIWGGVVNESRSITRQLITFPWNGHDAPGHGQVDTLVRMQLAWVNALKLQLRERKDPQQWEREVERLLPSGRAATIMKGSNRATWIGLEMGRGIRQLLLEGSISELQFKQLDETLTRLTDLQGRAERIKGTPLPRHYDYYTLGFLDLFILFFPFAMLPEAGGLMMELVMLPVGVVVSWIFYQIFIFGKVMASPFANWTTDVPLDAIANTIEIDLKELLGAPDVPQKARPVDGVLW